MQGCFIEKFCLVEIGSLCLGTKILKFLQSIFAIRYYLPLEKAVALYLNKLESLNNSRMLCAKFGWNWPIGFSNFINVFPLFPYNVHLKKSVALYLNKCLWIFFIQGYFVSSLLEIGPMLLEKQMKCEMFTTTMTTYNKRPKGHITHLRVQIN